MTSSAATRPTNLGQGAACPQCRHWHQPPPPWPSRCERCHTRIGLYTYSPPLRLLDTPEAALPDDVACAFHPNKRAVEVCEGTGSYICTLCAVPVDGKTYSAEFINSGGLKKLAGKDPFDRKLPRPDLAAISYAALILIAWWTVVGGPILLAASIFYYVKHLRLRQSDPLYARVTSPLTSIILPILYVAIVGGFAFAGLAIWQDW
jgi:hypothetical protein